jgi:hypothetical protein
MSVELESAKRLTALKNKIDTVTETPSNTLSESVDNVIAGYGQSDGEDAMLQQLKGELVTYEENTLTEIVNSAFRNDNVIEEVSFPEVTKISTSAFTGCTKLKKAYFPKLTEISGDHLFYNCGSLTDIYAPLVTKLPYRTFYGTSLSTVDFPEVTELVSSVFSYDYKIVTVNFPKCTIIGVSSFQEAGVNSWSASFPVVESIGDLAFAYSGIGTFVQTAQVDLSISDKAFTSCGCLKNFSAGGTLVKSLNLSWAINLTLDSAKNIITKLKDYAGTDNEYVYTVTFSAKTKELLEAEGATAPNGNTWLDYAQNKGWNV